jgi:hypothetical protein
MALGEINEVTSIRLIPVLIKALISPILVSVGMKFLSI